MGVRSLIMHVKLGVLEIKIVENHFYTHKILLFLCQGRLNKCEFRGSFKWNRLRATIPGHIIHVVILLTKALTRDFFKAMSISLTDLCVCLTLLL